MHRPDDNSLLRDKPPKATGELSGCESSVDHDGLSSNVRRCLAGKKNGTSVQVFQNTVPADTSLRRIAGRRYGFILANINRNILLADLPSYAAALERGGDLVMSGFLEADVPAIVSRAKELGMELVETASREGWQMVHVRKTE